MSPATILLLIQGIEAAIAAAPKAMDVITKAKDFITAMFTAGAISKAQQDALHLRIDSMQALALAGVIPDHWQVQPDPQ